jgi:hypothetical protein
MSMPEHNPKEDICEHTDCPHYNNCKFKHNYAACFKASFGNCV